MAQARFAYSVDLGPVDPDGPPARAASDAAGLPLAISLYADRAHVAAQLAEDAQAAGFRIGAVAGLDALLDDDARPLGDIVVIDCPVVGGAQLAALARIDCRAAHTGAQLVVSTSVAALDDVFACLDQSSPQILVDPSRAERVIALGRALAGQSGRALRELAEPDRMALLRLTEQVSRIAERLDQLSGTPMSDAGGRIAEAGVFRFESPQPQFAAAPAQLGDRLAPAPASTPAPRCPSGPQYPASAAAARTVFCQ